MFINELKLKNFRGFESRELSFSERFTVLIGNNGTGKTGILDGLSIGLGSLLLGFDGVDSRNIRADEVHLKEYKSGELQHLEPQHPVKVTCDGQIEGQEVSWYRSIEKRRGSTTRIGVTRTSLYEYSTRLQQQVSEGIDVPLPLIAYYGSERLWVHKRNYKAKKASKSKQKGYSRFDGFTDCLESTSNFELFREWYKKMAILQLQKKKEIAVFESVRKAISTCMIEWKQLDYDFEKEELFVITEQGNKLPFGLLSDGFRNMLAMIADIAYRMAILNPFFGQEVTEKTKGVVLIDEIDLHLHPKWQRRIVEDLKRAFPSIQFIVTTHSPFIIQSLKEGELRRLEEVDTDERVEQEKYVNQSLEDVVENVMDIPLPQRSKRLTEMYEVAKDYYRLLQNANNANQEEKIKLKKKLDKLSSPYSDEVAYYAFLEMERISAGVVEEEDETD